MFRFIIFVFCFFLLIPGFARYSVSECEDLEQEIIELTEQDSESADLDALNEDYEINCVEEDVVEELTESKIIDREVKKCMDLKEKISSVSDSKSPRFKNLEKEFQDKCANVKIPEIEKTESESLSLKSAINNLVNREVKKCMDLQKQVKQMANSRSPRAKSIEAEFEKKCSSMDLPEIEDEEVAFMCDDDTTPDGNGCCSGEIYTDLGDGEMVCCPEYGDECFKPLK